MIINGEEYYYDATQPKTLKLTIKMFQDFAKADKATGEDVYKRLDIFKELVPDYLDKLFGKGTGDKICGKKHSPLMAMQAFAEIEKEYYEQYARIAQIGADVQTTTVKINGLAK